MPFCYYCEEEEEEEKKGKVQQRQEWKPLNYIPKHLTFV